MNHWLQLLALLCVIYLVFLLVHVAYKQGYKAATNELAPRIVWWSRLAEKLSDELHQLRSKA